MGAVLAATPLAVILIGMAILRRSAVLSGAAGLALAVVLALTAFRPSDGIAPMMTGVGTEALHTVATILWIILPALALFEFQKASGAILRIRDMLASLTGERRLQNAQQLRGCVSIELNRLALLSFELPVLRSVGVELEKALPVNIEVPPTTLHRAVLSLDLAEALLELANQCHGVSFLAACGKHRYPTIFDTPAQVL